MEPNPLQWVNGETFSFCLSLVLINESVMATQAIQKNKPGWSVGFSWFCSIVCLVALGLSLFPQAKQWHDCSRPKLQVSSCCANPSVDRWFGQDAIFHNGAFATQADGDGLGQAGELTASTVQCDSEDCAHECSCSQGTSSHTLRLTSPVPESGSGVRATGLGKPYAGVPISLRLPAKPTGQQSPALTQLATVILLI
jgi:hypothetical protein